MTSQVQSSSQAPLRSKSPSFFRTFLRLAAPFWNSPEERVKAWVLLGAVIVLTVAQVYLSLRVNIWSAQLFDALEQKSMERFLAQIGVLAIILVVMMAVNATHLWAKRRLQLNWRRWLTWRLLGQWMEDGRHFQLSHIPGSHDNPDGRIAEDVRITTEAAIDLGHSLFYCLLLLVGFTQILWTVSGSLPFDFGFGEVEVPGHMVWVALAYSAAGSGLAFLLGRPMIRAVDRRQTAEADFRFALVRARENSEAIALIRGERDERRQLLTSFKGIRNAWHRQTQALARIFMFTSGYSVLSTAFPLLVAAPRYIGGSISLGVLMQTAQAFQQLVGALSWPVDNLPRVAEWRASVERVLALTEGLERVEEHNGGCEPETRICVGHGEAPVLALSDLSIATASGEVMISGFDAEIAKGEHVLITGDPGAALKLFKVVAGLWPWGRGMIELPHGASIFFMPQRPYMPIEPLRDALAFPAAPDSFDNETVIAALERVGLAHLAARLSDTAAWEQVLTLGELQRLGFARLLLHRPDWIFIQEATDALGPTGEEDMMRLLAEEFTQATVLTVGYHPSLEAWHDRTLTLIPSVQGAFQMQDSQTYPQRDRRRWGRQMRWFSRLHQAMRPDAAVLTPPEQP